MLEAENVLAASKNNLLALSALDANFRVWLSDSEFELCLILNCYDHLTVMMWFHCQK